MASPSESMSMAIEASPILVQGSSSWLGLFGRVILSVLHLVSVFLFRAIKLATITIPSLLFTLFSTTWTVTMNASTLMLIFGGMLFLASFVVRYRFLNVYSRLPPEPQRKQPEIDLFPDTQEGGPKSGLSSYLDEFLSAIKIFGYLERPVFHELTRSMQTRKLIAGETLNLEDEKGFCIVVDGFVEIFVKSGRNYRPPAGRGGGNGGGGGGGGGGLEFADEEEMAPGHQRYQLLTEVRNGAPMSSLFSIMSLFTEDIALRQSDDAAMSHHHVPADSPEPPPSAALGTPISMPLTTTADAENLPDTPLRSPPPVERHPSSASRIPPMMLDGSAPVREIPRPKIPDRRASTSAHPDVIARATVDTTIAIIPASAFRRLIKTYPKATTHIVHVILTRFQRVTLAQAYSYLGLAGEVLETERSMTQYAVCQLPNILRGDALSRLKEKFNRERERMGTEDEDKGIALHNAAAGRRRRSSTTLRREAALQSMARHLPLSLATASRDSAAAGPHPSPGDLLGDIQIPRLALATGDDSMIHAQDALRREGMSPLQQRSFDPFEIGGRRQRHTWLSRQETFDEDNLFRVSVLECMFKALGLGTSANVSREAGSLPGSPRLVSYDQRRQNAIFSNNNAFGFMGPYDGSVDGETESLISGVSATPTSNPPTLPPEMQDEVEIVFFPKGSLLVEQGERSPGLYYVIDGFLDILASNSKYPEPFGPAKHDEPSFSPGADVPSSPYREGHGHERRQHADPDHRRSVSMVKPGGLAPYVSTVSSYRSFVDVVARTDVYVGFLPRASLERVVERHPNILLTMAKRLTSILPRLILHIDFALEWIQVNAGQVIFHDGDESDSIYIVLNGRLRLVEEKKHGGVSVKAEFGQGDSVGELEVLTESARSGTLHAIRDTEVVKFPRTLFNSLAQEHPNITIKISKIIASRMRSLVDDSIGLHGRGMAFAAPAKSASTINLRTVAILPVASGVPVVEFGDRLMHAFSQVGPPNGATLLNQSAILKHLGKHAFNRIGKLRLSQYLADLEEKYGLVVYVADTNVNSPWTQTCITQADCILIVGLAEGSPEIGEYERFMLGMKSTARKILVLIHADRYSRPGLARSWLRNRMWINGGHHHVQMTFESKDMPIVEATSSRRTGPSLKQRVQILQAEITKYTSRKMHPTFYPPDTPVKGDFHRLARRLCGKTVGLVLGGGGARGISQIGIIRAMEEEGIPVDIVGGTSIGAFIGALYARHADVVPIYGLAKKFAGRMSSLWRMALDLTYPSAAYTTGHEFNRGIFKTFGDAQIEDFWLEFYCNTTNISKSRQEFHTSGYAWRYIRASMSLAGLIPPLCDEGSMLLDGGYIDNLTVSHMKRLGAHIIFAIDVGSIDDDTPQAFGDTLSGFWSVFNRWNPFSSVANPPTLAEIQGRLAYVSSVDALERAKTMPGCIYMRPPVDPYGTLEFGKFDEIYQVGYDFGKATLRRLREEGGLPFGREAEDAKLAMRRTRGPRRASI